MEYLAIQHKRYFKFICDFDCKIIDDYVKYGVNNLIPNAIVMNDLVLIKHVETLGPQENNPTINCFDFLGACVNIKAETFKYIYEHNILNMEYIAWDDIIRIAIATDNIKLLTYLHECNIPYDVDDAIQETGIFGNIRALKYLELVWNDYTTDLLKTTIKYNRLELFKYLYERNPAKIDLALAMQYAVMYERAKIVTYIYDLDNSILVTAICISCINRRDKICKYLSSLCDKKQHNLVKFKSNKVKFNLSAII